MKGYAGLVFHWKYTGTKGVTLSQNCSKKCASYWEYIRPGPTPTLTHPPYHPQSEGMVERFNQTLERYLAKLVEDHQKDWDRDIPIFLLAYTYVL